MKCVVSISVIVFEVVMVLLSDFSWVVNPLIFKPLHLHFKFHLSVIFPLCIESGIHSDSCFL